MSSIRRVTETAPQENELTGNLEAYAAAAAAAQPPSATRFLSLGSNHLSGGVPVALRSLAAFAPGDWNVLDGLLFEKTLNLSHNELTGQLPGWALQFYAADEGLTVNLEVGGQGLSHCISTEWLEVVPILLLVARHYV
jgi:hypothetical protein